MMNEQMQEESSEQVKKVLPMTQEVVKASDPMDGKDAQERSLAIVQNLMTDLKRIFAEKVSPKLMDDQKFLLLTDELMETGKMQCIGYRMEAGILGVSGLIAEVLKGNIKKKDVKAGGKAKPPMVVERAEICLASSGDTPTFLTELTFWGKKNQLAFEAVICPMEHLLKALELDDGYRWMAQRAEKDWEFSEYLKNQIAFDKLMEYPKNLAKEKDLVRKICASVARETFSIARSRGTYLVATEGICETLGSAIVQALMEQTGMKHGSIVRVLTTSSFLPRYSNEKAERLVEQAEWTAQKRKIALRKPQDRKEE